MKTDLTETLIGGKLRVERLLGSGSMGEVYLVRNTLTNGRHALKVLLPQWTQYPPVVQQLIVEAQTPSRIQHPAIVPVQDKDTLPDGRPYLLMEYLDGKDLRALVDEHGSPRWLFAKNVLAQAASGFAAAHCADVLHRDIKPSNIFVTERRGQASGNVKILDFGIAEILDHASEHRHLLSMTNFSPGTPAYMAPELATLASRANIRTEIYSFGLVAYFILCGDHPFLARDRYDQIAQQKRLDDVARPHEIHPEVPQAVGELVMRMLSYDPEGRPASMEEVRRSLQTAPNKRTLVRITNESLLAARHARSPKRSKARERVFLGDESSPQPRASKPTDRNRDTVVMGSSQDSTSLRETEVVPSTPPVSSSPTLTRPLQDGPRSAPIELTMPLPSSPSELSGMADGPSISKAEPTQPLPSLVANHGAAAGSSVDPTQPVPPSFGVPVTIPDEHSWSGSSHRGPLTATPPDAHSRPTGDVESRPSTSTSMASSSGPPATIPSPRNRRGMGSFLGLGILVGIGSASAVAVYLWPEVPSQREVPGAQTSEPKPAIAGAAGVPDVGAGGSVMPSVETLGSSTGDASDGILFDTVSGSTSDSVPRHTGESSTPDPAIGPPPAKPTRRRLARPRSEERPDDDRELLEEANALLAEARQLLTKGDRKAAAELLAKVVGMQERSNEAWGMLAEIHFQNGKYSRARDAASKAVLFSSGRVRLDHRLELGDALFNLGEKAKACSEYEAVRTDESGYRDKEAAKRLRAAGCTPAPSPI